jgi:hypothetical protein
MTYNTKPIEKCKVVGLEIVIGLRNDMVRFIQERIIDNLEATKRFLGLNETKYDDICAGIYTYAIEEYGKILFLNSLNPMLPPNNNKIKIKYTHDNNGFLDHDHKFNLALNDKDLPDSCKVLLKGGFTNTGFTKSGFTQPTIPDFETRMAVFYADFDENKNYNSILTPPQVDRGLLENAVHEFLKFMNAQRYPYWVFMISPSALILPSRIGMEASEILYGQNYSSI